ncbi:hypothetical protein OG596_32510 [Streptomyces sp. NBC_01102]|uniref:hypothetical protein n=1 Tax=Streptomyces sp. NBC_01102 TaxID=2903749 RepID=UPI003865FC75|nr:hypothetical protein OG596_32510 [Streptomyces sp. NBC_01102]
MDPIATWRTVTTPKPLLEPGDVLDPQSRSWAAWRPCLNSENSTVTTGRTAASERDQLAWFCSATAEEQAGEKAAPCVCQPEFP